MKQDYDIGKIYKEIFENFAQNPPKSAWKNIASRLDYSHSQKNIFKQPTFIITTAVASIVALLLIIWLTKQPSSNSINEPFKKETAISDSAQQTNIQAKQNLPVDSMNNKIEHKNKIPVSVVEPFQIKNAPTFQAQDVQIISHQDLSEKQKPELQTLQEETKYQSEIIEPAEIELENDISENPSVASIETQILNYQIISVCKGEEVILTAGDGQNYQWSNGLESQNITIQAVDNCIYYVNYTNQEGNKVKQTFDIHLLNCSVYIPKAFSPNNDGFNDIYKVEAEGLIDFEIKIFSQWGELVFQSKDIHSGWDGRIKGNRAPSGIYIYQIRYTDPISQKRAFFGTLTLLP